MSARPSAVLISGQLLTAEVWTPLVAAAADDVNFMIADHTRDASVAGMASRLLREAPPAFALVGHALGGFVGLEVVRQAPDRVRSLALLASAAGPDGPAQTERRQGYLRKVEAGQFDAVVEERLPTLVHPARREDQVLMATLRRMALATGPQNFMRQQQAIMDRPDSRPSLAGIACPTLLVAGRDDAMAAGAPQEEMRAAISDARLEVVDHCGHMLTLEQPRTLAGLLGDWLTRRA